MREKKKNIILLIFVLCLSLALVTAGLSLYALSVVPTPYRLDDGITSLETDLTDDVFYYGNESGTVNKVGGDGTPAGSVKLSDYPINFIGNCGEMIVAADQSAEKKLFFLSEELELLGKKTLGYSIHDIIYANGSYFVFSAGGSNLFIQKFDSSFDLTAGGAVYYYDEYENSMERLIINVNKVFVSSDGNNIYVTGDGAYAYRIGGDLSALTDDVKVFMDSDFEELTTLHGYIRAACYDSANDALYIGTSTKYLVKLCGGGVDDEAVKSLKEVPSSLAYDPQNDTVFVSYDLFGDISVVPLGGGSSFDFGGDFNIRYIKTGNAGERLYSFYRENGTNKLGIYDVSVMKNAKTLKSLGTAGIVTAIVLLIAAAVSGVLLYKVAKGSQVLLSAKKILKKVWKQKFIYLVFLPSLALLFIFCYYPAVSSMILSFFDYKMGSPKLFVGFSNFTDLFTNSVFITAIKNMLIFLGSDIVFGIVPPVLFALCLMMLRSKKLSKVFRILMYLPTMIPAVVNFLIWSRGIYGDYGALNSILKLFGGEPIAFLGDYRYSIPSLIFMGFPFLGSYLIFYGALMNIPPDYYEYAELEGCKPLRRIFTVDIPLITPQIKYIFVLTFISSVQNVGRIMMTTGGQSGTQVPVYMMYNYLSDNNYGASSAVATFMFAGLLVATFINLKLKTKEGS